MKSIKIKVSSRYEKNFHRLPKGIQNKTIGKICLFRENPFNSVLKTHPLTGKLKNCWAFWVDFHYRVVFIFLSEEKALFLDIGTHNIYKC